MKFAPFTHKTVLGPYHLSNIIEKLENVSFELDFEGDFGEYKNDYYEIWTDNDYFIICDIHITKETKTIPASYLDPEEIWELNSDIHLEIKRTDFEGEPIELTDEEYEVLTKEIIKRIDFT